MEEGSEGGKQSRLRIKRGEGESFPNPTTSALTPLSSFSPLTLPFHSIRLRFHTHLWEEEE